MRIQLSRIDESRRYWWNFSISYFAWQWQYSTHNRRQRILYGLAYSSSKYVARDALPKMNMIEAWPPVPDENVYRIGNAKWCLTGNWIDQTSLGSPCFVAETEDSHHQPTVSFCSRPATRKCPWTTNWEWPRDIPRWSRTRHVECRLCVDDRRRCGSMPHGWMLEYERRRWSYWWSSPKMAEHFQTLKFERIVLSWLKRERERSSIS